MGMSSSRDFEFGQFVAAQSAPLLHYAQLLTRDRQLAEDLVQEALIKVYLRWGSIRVDPLSYTRRAVLNQFLSGKRKRRVTEVPIGERDPEGATEEISVLGIGLEALSERERATVVLRYHLDEVVKISV